VAINIGEENNQLTNYLKNKINNNEKFIIPRIAGVENNFVLLGIKLMQNQITQNEMTYIKNVSKTMKNNAGIKLTGLASIAKYSKLYLDAFHKCDAYFEWEKWGEVYKYIQNSHDFITNNFKDKNNFGHLH